MKVLIIGISGQDGSLMADLMREKGFQVYGLSRRLNRPDKNIYNLDFSDTKVANALLESLEPDLIFHLAAVHESSEKMNEFGKIFKDEMFACHVEITRNILKWQESNLESKSFFALSSQMYTPIESATSIKEDSLVNPSSIYGESKAEAWNVIKRFRDDAGVIASTGIFFNHSSTRSKSQFLLPQIATQIVELFNGQRKHLELRNAEARIDISDASEIMQGAWSALQLNLASDFVFGSNSLISIRDLIKDALILLDKDYHNGLIHSSHATAEAAMLVSNTTKAKEELGWAVKKNGPKLLAEMVKSLKTTH